MDGDETPKSEGALIPTGRSVSYRYRNAWCLIPHRKQGTRDLLSTSSKHQKCKHHINIVNDTGTDTTNNQRSGISQYIIGLSHGKHRRRKTSYKIDLSKKAIDNHFQAHSKSRLSFLPCHVSPLQMYIIPIFEVYLEQFHHSRPKRSLVSTQ